MFECIRQIIKLLALSKADNIFYGYNQEFKFLIYLDYRLYSLLVSCFVLYKYLLGYNLCKRVAFVTLNLSCAAMCFVGNVSGSEVRSASDALG